MEFTIICEKVPERHEAVEKIVAEAEEAEVDGFKTIFPEIETQPEIESEVDGELPTEI